MSGINELETVVMAGDFNGHVGELADGFEGVHGGKGFGDRNTEGELLLELEEARCLTAANTCFEKEERS